MRKVRIMYRDVVPASTYQEYLCFTAAMAERFTTILGKSLDYTKFYILNDEVLP